MRVVAILDTMWGWRGQTSGAGYGEAPRYFRINPENYSGRRLYKLVGPNARLLVTNACRDLATSATGHGTPNPTWLAENLRELDEFDSFDVLLVCGKVAQATYHKCNFIPKKARVIEIPHPAARGCWTRTFMAVTARYIQKS